MSELINVQNLILLVDNCEKILDFFYSTFNFETPNKDIQTPFLHASLKLTKDITLIIVQRSNCGDSLLKSLTGVSVQQIMVTSGDITAIQQRGIKAGGVLTETISDNLGGGYVIQGPERISLYLLNPQTKANDQTQIFLNSLMPKVDVKSDEEEDRVTAVTNPRPIIHTLNCKIMNIHSPDNFAQCPPNLRTAMPFETEIFKGTALLMVRTNPIDSHYRMFFHGTKREFEVQVQGKFKRQPDGEIYVGAEACAKMELGIITRSVCRIVLNFVGTMVNDLHYSFGDSHNDKNCESAHLVAPLLRGMDKVVVTPQGETPPQIGTPFYEAPDSRKKRMKTSEKFLVDLNCTYSFSVNTANMDLCSWNIVGVPLAKTMDMRSLFGDTGIRLVAYEMPNTAAKLCPTKHPKKDIRYVFNMGINPIDPANYEDFDESRVLSDEENDINKQISQGEEEEEGIDSRIEDSDGEDESIQINQRAPPVISGNSPGFGRMARNSIGNVMNTLGRIRKIRGMSQSTEENTITISDENGRGFSEKNIEDRGTMSGWFRSKINDITITDSMDVPETADYVPTNYDLESDGDLRYCPACIEASDHRKEGRRRLLFVIPHSLMPDSKMNNNQSSPLQTLVPRLRSYAEFARTLGVVPIPKHPKNKKLSIAEKRRRQIVESFKLLLDKNSSATDNQISSFLLPFTESDKNFLGNYPIKHTTTSKSGGDQWEGSAAMATSRRHWEEIYMVLNSVEFSVHKTKDTRRANVQIPLSSVLSVRALEINEVPIYGYFFFEIETLSRIYYFLVLSEVQIREWLGAFSHLISDSPEHSKPFSGSLTKKIMSRRSVKNQGLELDDAYLARPVDWKMDKRRVYNYRRIFFRLPLHHKISTNQLVENILTAAFDLSGNQTSELKWIEFLDLVSLLQTINLSELGERQRTAVFLNLYHIMILHGNMVQGPPVGWSSWPSFFNSISYIVNFEIITIAELEYNILRGSMSRPSPLISKITVPNSQFPGLALVNKDFRINFCINCGSKSLPEEVPIYKPDILDEQLDEITFLNVSESLEIDSSKKIVFLPKLCSWYLPDFIPKKLSANSPIDCLRALSHYTKEETKSKLRYLFSDTNGTPTIKFKNFTYRCRSFIEYKSEFEASYLVNSKQLNSTNIEVYRNSTGENI